MIFKLKKAFSWLKKYGWLCIVGVGAIILSSLGIINKKKMAKLFKDKDKQTKQELKAIDKAKKEKALIEKRYKEGLEVLEEEKKKKDEKVTRDNRKKLKDASSKVKNKAEMKKFAKALAKKHGIKYEE